MGRKVGEATVEVGETFGKWTVVSVERIDGRWRVECRCDCGVKSVVRADKLIGGHSPGCRRCGYDGRKISCGRISDHGRLYDIWRAMRARCGPRAEVRKRRRYYERGIRVCEEWQKSFVAFRDWALANGYRDGLTIDREDNDGDYCPDNCRWVTAAEQALNRSTNVRHAFGGDTKTVSEWAMDPQCAVCESTLRVRLWKGAPFEEALTTPPRPYSRRRQLL